MYSEDSVQSIQQREVCVPESVYQIVQALGSQLTSYDAGRGSRQVDITRAMPICMILADNDVERAAHLLQGFVDAMDAWNVNETSEDELAFNGQPVP